MKQKATEKACRFNRQSLEVIRLVCERHQEWVMQRAWAASDRLARALKGGKDACDIAVILRSMRFLQELLGELIAIEQLCNRLKGGCK